MTVETVLVGLPGTLCSPAVFEPMTRALAGEVDVVPFSWLTRPGPWDVPSVAERVADHLAENWPRPVIVCGHSTGGVIALQLAVRHPALVGGLVLVDTGAHMHRHGDVGGILQRVKDNWGWTCGRPSSTARSATR
jgi:pimeloyl-ACP methyl ester carboxylesterase